MKAAKIMFWVSGKTDSRDTAGMVASITIPQSKALLAARAIEGDCERLSDYPEIQTMVKIALAETDKQFPSLAPYRQVEGHGVTIKYESGRLRTIRRGW